jgi:hypothetical protein
MKRRDFLTITAGASLALLSPFRSLRAAPGDPDDKLWIFFDANGGWDPTRLCDPHAHEDFTIPDVYTAGDIMTNAYGIPHAPKTPGEPWSVEGSNFFDKYAEKLLVINGVDGQTNNHLVGSRNMWSGRLNEGNPSLGGLIAGIRAQVDPTKLPTAFLSTGGFDRTNRMVPATRVASTKPLKLLTRTNLKNVDNEDTRYYHPEVLEKILSRQVERHSALLAEQGLPQIKDALMKLQTARETEYALGALLPYLNDIPEIDSSDSNRLKDPARMMLAAMAAEICVSGNLSLNGFDTHANHDVLVSNNNSGHRPQIQELLDAIDYVWTLAEDLNLADRLVVVVGSEMGRTKYNGVTSQAGVTVLSPGKDHWPITSMMLMGNDIPPGVIGQTTADTVAGGVEAFAVRANGSSVEIVDPSDVSTAPKTLIRQVHLHHALRCLAGIKDHELTKKYPINVATDFTLPILPNAPGWETFG